MKEKFSNQAYSLIELSSVLAIIALIVGGIIASDSITKSAQIRSIISDVTSYKSATKLFEQKYGNLPGDIKASSIWASANNGNEDGRIGYGTAGNADMPYEPTYAWQHLKLANLVNFISQTSAPFPPGKIDGSCFFLYDQNTSTAMYNRTGTYLGLGSTSSVLPWNAAVTRVMATAIDNKIDDGLPTAGMVYTTRGDDMNTSCSGTSCSCVSNYWNGNTSANYVFSDSSKSCRMIFWLKELN